jgi:hypothetical protein
MSPESTPTPTQTPIPDWARRQANNIDYARFPHAATDWLFNTYLKDDPAWYVPCENTPETKQTFYLLVLESEGYPYLSIPNDLPKEEI